MANPFCRKAATAAADAPVDVIGSRPGSLNPPPALHISTRMYAFRAEKGGAMKQDQKKKKKEASQGSSCCYRVVDACGCVVGAYCCSGSNMTECKFVSAC